MYTGNWCKKTNTAQNRQRVRENSITKHTTYITSLSTAAAIAEPFLTLPRTITLPTISLQTFWQWTRVHLAYNTDNLSNTQTTTADWPACSCWSWCWFARRLPTTQLGRLVLLSRRPSWQMLARRLLHSLHSSPGMECAAGRHIPADTKHKVRTLFRKPNSGTFQGPHLWLSRTIALTQTALLQACLKIPGLSPPHLTTLPRMNLI